MSQRITLNVIGLQVEVLQGYWNRGGGGQLVVREVHLHQAGVVKGLWVDAAALQAAVAETQILQVEKTLKTALVQPREIVVGQIKLLDRGR